MWRRADSNRWPPACKAGALPAELRPLFRKMGLSGVEPLTSRLSGERSNQLSYRPCNFNIFLRFGLSRVSLK